MSSSTGPGLTEAQPPPEWLEGPHGRLAFFAYPAPQPWLHLLVSHGFGEHSGWWHHVAEALRAAGVSAYLFDHYHHGRSAGAAGDAADYAPLVAGLRTALEQGAAPRIASGAPRVPTVLLGHSNGALVTVLALAELAPTEVQGVVLCSPFLGFPPKVAWGGTLLAWGLRLFSPRLRVPLANRPWRLTTCRAIWPQYGTDPLRFRSITVRFFLAMRRALAAARPLTALGVRPLLLLSAGRERVVNPAAMQDWYARADAPDKSQRHYPEARHELFNETRWEVVLADVLTWARQHFAATGSPVDRPAGSLADPAQAAG